MVSKQSTNQHQRTRRDHATETAEDYVEAIAAIIDGKEKCRVTDLAEHFAVSHVTVTKTVSRLKKEGLVETEPYGPIFLTSNGRALAENSRVRHVIVLDFLLALGVTQATAQFDSEGIEHHVSQETLQRMKEFTLRQPKPDSL